MRYLLIISYDGTNFSGFQKQNKGERTVQQELEKALKILLKQDVNVVASGRTDAGVHAYNQAVHIESNVIADKMKFLHSINGILPEDVKVKSIKKTNVHARFSAKKKTYLYKMYISHIDLPLYNSFLRIPKNCDLKLMKQAGEILLGEHDFKNFCASGSDVKSTVKTIYSIKWKKMREELHFYITGNGFLYKMVRNIIGIIIQVGLKKITLDEFKNYLILPYTEKHYTAPSKALYLYKVVY